MKKLIVLSVYMCVSFVSAQKIEISSGYGLPSMYGISNDIGTSLVSSITEEGEPNSIGALNFSVMTYNKNDKWRYGLDIISEFFSVKNSNYGRKSTISIMPRTDYFWSGKNRKFRIYSGVSAGIYLEYSKIKYNSGQEEKVNNSIFGFNVTPIGFRYGNDLAVFVEPNIGTKGIVQIGVSYRF